MKSKQHRFNLTWYIKHITMCISFFGLISVNAFANESDYQLNETIQLSHVNTESLPWLQLVGHPQNTHQYFIINNVGEMYFVDDMGKQNLVLNINANTPQDSTLVKLTAIELHPNFTLRDQIGFGTFYTAHLELLDKKSRTKRIQESSDELTLKFDAVITEWKFHSTNYKKVDETTKREVLRIAVPDKNITIKQMSFSPYEKSWNDNFGVLYIALNGQEKWQKALYSGVILRINPAKFGLRSFTVPSNNPYINDSSIKDEIYLLGGENIKQFIWPDKNNDDILLSHHYKGKSVLSFAGNDTDWRERAPRNIIYQDDNPIDDVLLYRGASLTSLRNKLLLLRQEDERWLIESLSIQKSLNNLETPKKPQPDWQLSPLQLTNNSEILLSNNRDGEVLIVDKTAGMVFQMSHQNSALTKPAEKKVTISENQGKSNYLFFILLIVTVVGGVFYILKRNRISAKAIVRKQFAHLELSESQQQLALYHRHEKSIDATVEITDIDICEVKLNDIPIAMINRKVGNGFDHEKEQYLRDEFEKEKINKMIDDKIRQISLSFTDIHKKTHTICLYMRKGEDRVTKKTYSAVIDDLIDWCWLIATKINPAETKQRKKKAVISSGGVVHSVVSPVIHSINSSKAKYSHISSEIKQVDKESNHLTPLATEKSVESNKADQTLIQEPETSIETICPPNQSNRVDTGIVDALEKLVTLKQQGFLTENEFTKAKENLLKCLFEEPDK